MELFQQDLGEVSELETWYSLNIFRTIVYIKDFSNAFFLMSFDKFEIFSYEFKLALTL